MATTLAALRQLARTRLLEPLALTTPGSPLVSPQGTPATTTITYKLVATNASGSSDASQGTTIATAAATLTGVNFNRLTWQAVPGATGYDIYRTATNGVAPLTLGKIGATTVLTTFDDTGLAGNAATAPVINTSGISSPFWTEQELLDLLILGCKDLWRAITDLHQGHFTTIDATNVSLVANATSLAGVPADMFRVLMIEPRDLTSTNSGRVSFSPKPYQNATFQSARTQTASDPTALPTIYYDIINAGSPVAAPAIIIAPPISSTVLLRLVYVHTLPVLVETDNNPIPGESDNALVAWCVAWARAKESEDRGPDSSWLAIYATDKQALLTALTPRQEQDAQVVEGLFDGWC